jgi:tRNA threonylcarbamoyladenosine biosynthesis protein TsaB
VKKNELYVGRYLREGMSVKRLATETSQTVEHCAEQLRASPQARVCGPAVPEYRQRLQAFGVARAQILDAPVVPSAGAVARLAVAQQAKWPPEFSMPALFSLEPHYLRGSGAEENPKFPPLPGVPARARFVGPKNHE